MTGVGHMYRAPLKKNMANDDIIQIKVDKHSVGVMGLNDAIEDMAGQYAERPDDEVLGELLKRLSKRNYIPRGARENYGKAFLREFKKFIGKPYDKDVPEGLQIKVLGPGCAQCDRLERELKNIMAETGMVADIEHVRDIKEIGKYGVMGTPALVINRQVKSVGSVPPKAKIVAWLKDAEKERKNS